MRSYLLLGLLLSVLLIVTFFMRASRADTVLHHDLLLDPDMTMADCLVCHDGSVGDRVAFCTVDCRFDDAHYIMNAYPPPDKEQYYAPMEVLASVGVKFEGGRVTCISCHNLRNPSRFHLVIDNSNDRLCELCHIDIP